MSRKHLVQKKCENKWQSWAHLNSKMLDKLSHARKEYICRKDSIVWLLSKDGYMMAEWLRLWTATLIWYLALVSKTISVGKNLRRDRKLKQTEIEAPHFKQQIQCLQNIWFKKKYEKTTNKCEHTLIRRCWTNLVMQRKREVQNRQQLLAFVDK